MARVSPDRRARRRRRNIDLVLFAGAVVGILIGVNTFFLHLENDPLADVHAYYDAATRLNAGLPLYEQAATTNQAEFYRYPPLFAIAFRPLALLPYETAALVWEALVVASFIGLSLRPSAGLRCPRRTQARGEGRCHQGSRSFGQRADGR